MNIHIPTESEKSEALASFFKSVKASEQAYVLHEASLIEQSPVLIEVLRGDTGQSEKVRKIIRSCWNGDHHLGLCDVLCGLDHKIGVAVLALISARVYMGGNADVLIHHILVESGEYARLCDECAAAA